MNEILCASNTCEYDTTTMESGNVFWDNRGKYVTFACPKCGNYVLLFHHDEEE